MKSGIVILCKEENMSSHTAVSRLRRILGADKAGHTGTLDPMATGVLPVLIERAVKASEYVTSEDKHYRATLLLGLTTDTEDITGTPLTHSDKIPKEAEVLGACKKFVGKITQIPPMYSAIKIGGKKLCDIAREGKTVERVPREIEIFSIGAKKINDREYSLDVHCSKGTYIRTLLADIGQLLGCGAVMKALERTECAGFTLADAHTLSQIESMSESERERIVIPTENFFRSERKVALPPFFARLARCGLEIYLKKISFTATLGERLKLYDGDKFFALAEVREFDGELAAKPIKQFDIGDK